MLTTIFRVILALAHIGYVVYETIKSRLIHLKNFTANIWHFNLERNVYVQNIKIRRYETLMLEKIVGRVYKLPVHLCIIVGYDEPVSFHHLLRMIGWCVDVRIPYVTLYDHNGFFKQNQNILRDECQRTRPKLAGLIDWETRASSKKITENGHNSYKLRTRVQMLSNVDGKGRIVTLAQNLSRAVSLGILKMEEIDAELLDDKLRLEDYTPDPDLVFVCGPALSTYGLLPWHTRTTEFFNLRSHRDVSINDFTFLLEKYGQCQQRYGK